MENVNFEVVKMTISPDGKVSVNSFSSEDIKNKDEIPEGKTGDKETQNDEIVSDNQEIVGAKNCNTEPEIPQPKVLIEDIPEKNPLNHEKSETPEKSDYNPQPTETSNRDNTEWWGCCGNSCDDFLKTNGDLRKDRKNPEMSENDKVWENLSDFIDFIEPVVIPQDPDDMMTMILQKYKETIVSTIGFLKLLEGVLESRELDPLFETITCIISRQVLNSVKNLSSKDIENSFSISYDARYKYGSVTNYHNLCPAERLKFLTGLIPSCPTHGIPPEVQALFFKAMIGTNFKI